MTSGDDSKKALAVVEGVFANRQDELGKPDAPTPAGFLALARAGRAVWNMWRAAWPEPKPDFGNVDFREAAIPFSGFLFGNGASFDGAQFGNEAEFRGAQFDRCASFCGTHFGDYADFIEAQFGAVTCFDGAQFGDEAGFEGANFDSLASFYGAQFGDRTSFQRVQFGDRASFDSAEFGDEARFDGANFFGRASVEQWATTPRVKGYWLIQVIDRASKERKSKIKRAEQFEPPGNPYRSVSFLGAQFGRHAFFEGAQFGVAARFDGAQFGGPARFAGAQFGDAASFDGAQFGDLASFDGAQFGGWASFAAWDANRVEGYWQVRCVDEAGVARRIKRAEQLDLRSDAFRSVSFLGVQFEGDVSFQNRVFQEKTDFGPVTTEFTVITIDGSREVQRQPTRFKGVPDFHGCKLHQNTSLDTPQYLSPASSEVARAYRTLKLMMAQQQAIREEQLFFHLEIVTEAALQKGARRCLFKLYEKLSDYGFSLKRPFCFWLGCLIVFGLAHGALANWSEVGSLLGTTFDWSRAMQWAQYVSINAVPLPGFDRAQYQLRLDLFHRDGVVMFAAIALEMLHKTCALIAVFFVGLALRNVFKMKG